MAGVWLLLLSKGVGFRVPVTVCHGQLLLGVFPKSLVPSLPCEARQNSLYSTLA